MMHEEGLGSARTGAGTGQRFFKKVAVLGAGVMGAQIAAHFANCGVAVVLFDLPGPDAAGPKGPYAIVERAKEHLLKAEPPPLARPAWGIHSIVAAHYDADLPLLRSCDLVIEAIAERLDLKHKLYDKIAPFLGENTILATNTSGIPLADLSAGLSESLRQRFCGVHFFNPPRYMNLVELIPGNAEQGQLLDDLETFLVSHMGKGVLRAKDTPNFVANRIGVFSLLMTLHHAERLGLSPTEVDALTGTAWGRPKSATYRTADVVGLDTLQHVVATMAQALPSDPWLRYFKLPSWIEDLVQSGATGQKVGQGIFKKQGKDILVYEAATKTYVVQKKVEFSDSIKNILSEKSWQKRLEDVAKSTEPAGIFLWNITRDLFHYCAFFLDDIADSARTLDLALRWGYGWEQGPFEIWQEAGWQNILAHLETQRQQGLCAASVSLPDWALDPLRKGVHESNGTSWSPESKKNLQMSALPVYQKQLNKELCYGQERPPRKIAWENEGVSVWQNQDDGIFILSFKTKMHTVNEAVLQGVPRAVEYAEKNGCGLILWQDELPFSAGADLELLLPCLKAKNWTKVESLVKDFQHASQCLKYSHVPTVAAVAGLGLGGGCEFIMHSQRVVAHLETYLGLVEVGVGILPAGGGCKELTLRASQHSQFSGQHVLPWLQKFFQNVAMAAVSKNAFHAQDMGLLRASDVVIAQVQELLFVAKAQVRALFAQGRPFPADKIAVGGAPSFAALRMLITNLRAGGFISAHDERISTHVARVLCGGEVEAGTLVDESWLLTLEREAFLELCYTAETEARVEHMLLNGRPLRN